MGVTVDSVLGVLPPYEDKWILIHPDQSVKDIIIEVLEAHNEFASYYDKIAPFFDGNGTEDICNRLYEFCKNNISYKEEPEELQTSALPTGLLTRGYGDCKHYAGFCGGVLDALNRNFDKKINWCYRFASYDILKKTPHHVFIVVNDRGNEIWIDPTPGANELTPAWITDKKIKAEPMALHRNISGIDPIEQFLLETGISMAIGKSSLTLQPSTTPFDGYYNHKFPNTPGMNPFLGLSQYRDEGGDRTLNSSQVADQLNQMIAQGPDPGHTVDGAFVEWVYDENIRSWNFYYSMGVAPGFTAASILPASYPHLVITDDGRLTFDKDVKIDDYRSDEIHMLTAWAQSLINDNDPAPYPIKPLHLKEFSQLKYGNVDERNLFTERRGTSFFHDVGKALEHTINFVKEGVLEVVGFIPRNAFLGLVGINAFNFAGNLWDNIQAGNWDKIAKTWETLGGKADKLRNTIEDGKDKKAILGSTGGQSIGVVQVAALVASAAPIVAALLAFLDKSGKAGEVLDATKGFLSAAYPDLDLTAYGFLDKRTGQTLQFQGSPAYNENMGAYNPGTMPAGSGANSIKTMLASYPLPVAAGAGVVAYLLTNKKGRKKNYIIPAAAAVGVYFLLTKVMRPPDAIPFPTSTTAIPATTQRQQVIAFYNQKAAGDPQLPGVIAVFNRMSDAEISLIYQWVSKYLSKNLQVPTSDPLYQQLIDLDLKYDFQGT